MVYKILYKVRPEFKPEYTSIESLNKKLRRLSDRYPEYSAKYWRKRNETGK
ncbi:MAG: hypothetical protein GF414_08545 [Candidatus Altiarchaeales archaeon]|nr:hypothetical protein [Candidatus Altiarchaeales archaeon]